MFVHRLSWRPLAFLVALWVAVGGTGPSMAAKDRGSFESIKKALRKPHLAVKLDLRRAGLDQLPPEIGKLTNLKELYLSQNQLADLPVEIRQLENLRSLGLSRNRFRKLPAVLWELATLEELYLDDNELARLPPGIGALAKLRRLQAGGNQIEEIPPELGRLVNLEKLWLTRNNILHLPAELGKLTALEGLFVSYNQLAEVPPEIGRLTRLEELYLNNNRLARVPPGIGDLTSLRVLDLSDNQLTELPPEIGRLENLERLFLDGNQLTELPPELAGLGRLRGLSLNGNRISTLPPQLAHLMRLPRTRGMFPPGFEPEAGPGPNRTFYLRGGTLFAPSPAEPAPAPDAGSLLASAEEILSEVETRQPTTLPFAKPIDLDELARVRNALRRYLEGSPGDVAAAILLARLGHASNLHTPVVFTPGDPDSVPDGPAPLDAEHRALDLALQAQPTNPELHYWKARLYGLQQPVMEGGTFQTVSADPAKAIDSARRALSLAPRNLQYRVALALYLVEDDRRHEALDLMRQLPGKPHRLAVLLADLEKLPAPDDAIPEKALAAGIIQMAAAAGQLGDYPQVRVVSYLVPRSAKDLEAFYAERIDGFALLRMEGKELASGTEVRGHVQLVTEARGLLTPAESLARIENAPPGGLSILVTEYLRLSAETRRTLEQRGYPAGLPDSFCHVLITNQRPSSARR